MPLWFVDAAGVFLAAMFAMYGIIVLALPQQPRTRLSTTLVVLAFIMSTVTFYHVLVQVLPGVPIGLLGIWMLVLNHATARYRVAAKTRRSTDGTT